MTSPLRPARCTALITALFTLGSAACGGDDPAAPQDPPPQVVASVTIDPPTVSLTAFGATMQLTATARSATGTEITGRSFTWSTSNSGVATVSAAGLVTAVANGTAGITAVTSGVSGSATVLVAIPVPQVSAGADHSCALNADGAAYCWGRNNFGQLGDGTTAARTRPVAVLGGHRFRTISAGYGHTCGVATTGEGYCWGNSDRGQVGDGGLAQRTSPARVSGVTPFSFIQAGRAHTCGTTPTGIVYCWGGGGNGEFGTGATVAQRVVPDSIHGGRRYSALGGAAHTICAVATTSEAWCWGRNNTGQVGDGTVTCTSLSAACFIERALPTRVLGGVTFASISANARIVNGFGGGTACGVTTTGAAYCWGQGSSGQIGDAGTSSRLTPVLVSGSHTWRVIAVGSASTCGVTTGGAGYCWGLNSSGALGDGTTINRLIPTAIAGNLTLASIGAGYDHTCAVTVGGDVYCWGENADGQLGDGTTTNRQAPVRVLLP